MEPGVLNPLHHRAEVVAGEKSVAFDPLPRDNLPRLESGAQPPLFTVLQMVSEHIEELLLVRLLSVVGGGRNKILLGSVAQMQHAPLALSPLLISLHGLFHRLPLGTNRPLLLGQGLPSGL